VVSIYLSSRIDRWSVINVNMRPAAGALGLVVHPTQGAWKSVQKMWAKEQGQYQRKMRLSDGLGDVQGSTSLEREAILEKFKTAKMTTKVRQKKYKDAAEKEMYGDQGVKTDRDTIDAATPQASAPLTQTSPSEQLIEDEDAAFERDLQLAKQLSIAEQRGYERGLARAESPSHDMGLPK
jgi:sterol 3beta-glucosyltransferase